MRAIFLLLSSLAMLDPSHAFGKQRIRDTKHSGIPMVAELCHETNCTANNTSCFNVLLLWDGVCQNLQLDKPTHMRVTVTPECELGKPHLLFYKDPGCDFGKQVSALGGLGKLDEVDRCVPLDEKVLSGSVEFKCVVSPLNDTVPAPNGAFVGAKATGAPKPGKIPPDEVLLASDLFATVAALQAGVITALVLAILVWIGTLLSCFRTYSKKKEAEGEGSTAVPACRSPVRQTDGNPKISRPILFHRSDQPLAM